MQQPKYTLSNIKQIKEDGRCGAIFFDCYNEECGYRFPDDDRTTETCPECGTSRRVCGGYSIKGRDHCGKHGGKTLMGVEHPSYQGKGYSKNLPTRLFEYYQMSLIQNPDGKILEMEDDIHLLETRKLDLESQLSKEGADVLWGEARKAYERFTTARKKATSGSTKAAEQMGDALDELEGILVKGYAQGAIWHQLLEVIDAQKKLREAEIRRREKANTVVTSQQVATLVGRIIGIVKERVLDQDVRKAILNDMQGLTL